MQNLDMPLFPKFTQDYGLFYDFAAKSLIMKFNDSINTLISVYP